MIKKAELNIGQSFLNHKNNLNFRFLAINTKGGTYDTLAEGKVVEQVFYFGNIKMKEKDPPVLH